MFMALSLKEKNQDVINQAIRELQRAANVDTPTVTLVGDTNYHIQPTDYLVNNSVSLTAPRTWTLPPISSVTQGQKITLLISASAANTLTVVPSGSDQLFMIDTGLTPASFVASTSPVTVEATAFTSGSAFWLINLVAEAWTPFTPTISVQGGGTISGTASARFTRIGPLVHVQMSTSVTAGAVLGEPVFSVPASLPISANNPVSLGHGRESTVNGFTNNVCLNGTSSVILFKYDNTSPFSDLVSAHDFACQYAYSLI